MKPAQLSKHLSPILPKLQCPMCQSAFALSEQSLLCQSGHCFDLSRRGYVNLAPTHDQATDKYSAQLFDSRHQVLEAGFFAPIAEAIAACLPAQIPFFLVDVGCGEGYYARYLADRFPMADVLGVDISRDAITTAARISSRAHFLVADLKRLPVASHVADVVLDVLTPSDYAEFGRVLVPEGLLIKVIPGTDYLCEVRNAVAPWLRNGDSYDNTRVLDHLRSHATVTGETEVRVTLPLTEESARAFLRMTPMTFGVPQDVLNTLSISQITLHMHVLQCKLKPIL